MRFDAVETARLMDDCICPGGFDAVVVFAGFKFCWIQVLLDSTFAVFQFCWIQVLLCFSFAGFKFCWIQLLWESTFVGFKICWRCWCCEFCWIQLLLDSRFAAFDHVTEMEAVRFDSVETARLMDDCICPVGFDAVVVFAGFKFCWIRVLLDLSFAGFKFCWIQLLLCFSFAGFKFCWIQLLLESTFAGFKICWRCWCCEFCWIQLLLDSRFAAFDHVTEMEAHGLFWSRMSS